MFTTRNQWKKWSLPSKLTAIGAYVGILGVIFSIVFFIIPYVQKKGTTKNSNNPKNETSRITSTNVERIIVQVHPDQYWFDTGIVVNAGDHLEFKANGSWWNGSSWTGPNGDIRPSCRKCIIPEGHLGELIGRITFAMDYGTSGMRAADTRISTDSHPFRIGFSAFHVAEEYGNLMLAMNEEDIGNHYRDNSGVLEVEIIVQRAKFRKGKLACSRGFNPPRIRLTSRLLSMLLFFFSK